MRLQPRSHELLPLCIVALTGCGGRAEDAKADRVQADASEGAGDAAEPSNPCHDSVPGHVEVVIENHLEEPIFLGPWDVGCRPAPRFEVYDRNGVELDVELVGPDTNCLDTCEEYLTSTTEFCSTLCAGTFRARLEPGESILQEWDGRYILDEPAPSECISDETPGSCPRLRALGASRYRFVAIAALSPSCSAPGCEVCLPSEGGCAPDAVIGEPIEAEIELTLDRSHGIARNGEEPPTPGTVTPIRIVFQ